MKILAIETATAACSVALTEHGALIAERHEIVGRGHAERLIPMIAELPEGGRADLVLVDCGPGSFTGVRVGLAAARALGFAWRVPVRGFSSMALVATAGEDLAGSVAVALIGGHGELFVQRFGIAPLSSLMDLVSAPPSDAAALLPEARVFGSGAAALIAARGWGEAREGLPRAADTILLPPAMLSLPPSPIYGRAPDAKLPV